ncbi:MAG: protein translocase subunit SecF, partial [Candidatus Zixiibacteriota bacterium]
MFRVIGDTNINFIGVRKYAFVLSLVLIVLGIVGFIMIVTGKANLGIDFAGGVMVTGHFEQPVTIEELRTAVTAQFPDAQITNLEDFEVPNAFIIKVKRPETEAEGRRRVETLR